MLNSMAKERFFHSNSLAKLHSHTILFSLLHFSSLSLLSSAAYTLPDQYFINCGSDSNTTVDGRSFVGDENPSSSSFSFSFSGDHSSALKDTNPATATSPLYQTARIFRNPSAYDLEIPESGNYTVRFHFHPFPSPNNLSDAHFNVSVSGFSLLSNFTVPNSPNSPFIKEFILPINTGKAFKIHFTPSYSSFAFVNAIEAFLLPENFIILDSATSLGETKTHYTGFLSHVLHTIHRINVGGQPITRDSDTLLRNWVPDDDYLIYPNAATNGPILSSRPNYLVGRANDFTAPDLVYKTAKQLNVSSNSSFNITWHFNVTKNVTHFVRAHFCDIVSQGPSNGMFNFYIYTMYSQSIDPMDATNSALYTPFYHDFLVDSDNSGLMSISIGRHRDFPDQMPFLNGLEIMELITDTGSGDVNENGPTHKMKLVIIIGSVGGGVAILCIVVVFFFGLKCRKGKAVDNFDRSLVYLYGGSSYSGITDRTVNASPIPNLNLGLKVPFADIVNATNNFDRKLMIGEGGFGKVYKGTFRSGKRVAVKRSEPGHGQGLLEFQTEIMVLSKIRYRHLVSLIGYCDERNEMILVYEFMEKGTLREHLYNSNESSELSWIRRLEICIGAAKGLHYLHTCTDGGIIHRDVKSTNILLDEHFVAKVADFGLSRSGPPDHTHISTEVKGSFGYLDPEYYRCLQLTQKSDVYSFGVVLLEVLCARPAINNMLPRDQVNLADWGISWQKKGQLEKIVDPLLEGKINPSSLRKFGETVEKCLKDCGVERPSMMDVMWDLEYALQLQQTAVPREPHEDSTNDASWGQLPLPVVGRFPSRGIGIDEEESGLGIGDENLTNVGEVFSQLKVDDAR